MADRRRGARRLAVMLALMCATALGTASTDASYSAGTATTADLTASEWTPPTVDASVVRKEAGGTAGFIASGGTYYVYASADDAGPGAPTGVASVQADLRSLTVGAAALTLSAGTWVVDGVGYAYRGGPVVVDAVVAEGPASYAVTATDGAGNQTVASGSVLVDDVAPTPTDVEAGNGVGDVGVVDAGDVVTLTWSEPVEPGTIAAQWSGSELDVTVIGTDGVAADDPDTLTIRSADGSQGLALGAVSLGRHDYLLSDVTMPDSTIVLAGDVLTITLGAPTTASPAAPSGPGGAGSLEWTAGGSVTDRAGNPAVGSAFESGASDRDF